MKVQVKFKQCNPLLQLQRMCKIKYYFWLFELLTNFHSAIRKVIYRKLSNNFREKWNATRNIVDRLVKFTHITLQYNFKKEY